MNRIEQMKLRIERRKLLLENRKLVMINHQSKKTGEIIRQSNRIIQYKIASTQDIIRLWSICGHLWKKQVAIFKKQLI